MSCDWAAALAFVGTPIALSAGGKFWVFEVAVLQEMRALNREADRQELSRRHFLDAVFGSNRSGPITNLVFFFAALPFCVNPPRNL